MEIVPLTYLDEFMLLFDRPADPVGIHMELRVEGRLDGDRLRRALQIAAERHPLAGAWVLPVRAKDRTWRFAIGEGYECDPVEELDCPTEHDVDAARDRLVSRRVPIDHPPLFRAVLAHHPSGDRFILNLHHVAGDGIGMVRFLRSVQRAYAADDDPPPGIGLNVARDLRQHLGIPAGDERRRRSEPLRRYWREALWGAPTRVASEGGNREGGQGCVNLHLSADEQNEIRRRRRPGATLNDLLLAAHQLTCDRWNEAHGRPPGRLGSMMAINVRPPAWRYDVLGNYVLWGTVTTRPAQRQNFDSTLRAVASWTEAYKRTGGGGVQIALDRLHRLPVGAKRLVVRMVPDRFFDTGSLSNLGRLPGFGNFGPEGGAVVEHWFSPPVPKALAVGMGAVSIGDQLFLSARYRRAQLDDGAARRFMELYRDVLLFAS